VQSHKGLSDADEGGSTDGKNRYCPDLHKPALSLSSDNQTGTMKMRTCGGKREKIRKSSADNRIHPPPPKPGLAVLQTLKLVGLAETEHSRTRLCLI
jgi:hypothetical protein